MIRKVGMNLDSLDYPPGSRIECETNRGNITLGDGSVINIKQNMGKLSLGHDCTIEGEDFCNLGEVVTGDECIIVNLKSNFGNIKFGSQCAVLSAGRNVGTITLGPNCHLPPFSRQSIGTVITYRNLDVAFALPPPEPIPIQNVVPVDHRNPDTEEEPQSFQIECNICTIRFKNMTFQCGHMFCIQCGEMFDICPVCRAQVRQRINLYN